jgi:hypothetical protein
MTKAKARNTTLAALTLLALPLPVLVASEQPAAAFSHMVTKGDSLALIAEKEYGDPKAEEILAFANALDSQGGSAIVPGMRLEVPAPSFHRADGHETWPDLARVFLGDERRADLLASVNDAVAWIAPSEGDQIVIPAVVTHLASEGESLVSFARKYWGDPNRAWQLAHYNGRAGDALVLGRGDVILVPLLDLTLTERGKAEAAHAETAARAEGDDRTHLSQKKIVSELPLLAADVEAGRYLEAVARGNRLVPEEGITLKQKAAIARALLESYVALDAPALATEACTAFRASADANEAILEAKTVSPKIRAACPSG